MLNGENMKYWILEILKAFTIPAILIVIVIVVLTTFIDINNQEISHIVLAVMLGVILGFSADFIKQGFNDLTKMQKLRKMSLRLLEEDVEDIYLLLWLYEWAQKSNQISEAVEKQLPPMIDFKYWNLLKQDKEFLLLAVTEPFNKIFNYMWGFEKTNSQIRLAEKGSKEAANIAIKSYKSHVKKEDHKKLLLLFKTEQEIKELDKKYTESTKRAG
jgi:hypothetical protein